MKIQTTGNAHLDKWLRQLAEGRVPRPSERKKLVGLLAGHPEAVVTSRLAAILEASAAKLNGERYPRNQRLRPFGLALRMSAQAIVARHDPRGDRALVDLWRRSPTDSAAYELASMALLGRVDPLDDSGHAWGEFDLARVAGVVALRELARQFPTSPTAIKRFNDPNTWEGMDPDEVVVAYYLASPSKAFKHFGRLVRAPNGKGEEELRSTILSSFLLIVPAIARDLRWKRLLKYVVKTSANPELAQEIIERTWP